jgi:hypothetical protein
MQPRVRLALLGAFAAVVGGCERPTVGDDRIRPELAPVQAAPAPHQPAPLDRVALVRPELYPPEVRGPTQIDAYLQGDARVDILWVVDNTGTMDNNRARLRDAFDEFITTLVEEQIEYQIGVTTTDMFNTGPGARGELIDGPRVITPEHPDPVEAFRSHVDIETTRLREEQGFAASLAALTEPHISGPNAGFLRDDADLAIVIFSDEDDLSLGEPDYFVRRFQALKGPGNERRISVSVIIGDVPDGCTPPGDEHLWRSHASPGFRYEHVAAHTGGLVESICTVDFTDSLVRLGLRFAGLRKIFPLSAEPDPATITVEVDDSPIARDPVNGWLYEAVTRSVQFAGRYVPPPGSHVRIRYDLEL